MQAMMKLFSRASSNPVEVNALESSEKVGAVQERCDMLLRSITAALDMMKAFALDVEELHSERFKDDIQALAARFQEIDKPKRQELHFEQKQQDILAFIDRQHAYIKDREQELRDIIDLLTKVMANLNVENSDFYHRINKQGEAIIKISGLDDIKKIKNALKAEVEQMWEIVSLKQDQERRQIRQLAGQVHTLQNQLVEARAKAMTDSLTGIYNRQALDEFLVEKIEHNSPGADGFSVLMVDIDNFKTINDKFGHIIGDRVLFALAQKCRASIRGEDFLARYGGEEFTIVLEGAAFRHALKIAQKLCNTIASVRYATSESQNGDYLCMTVSIGMTHYKKGDTMSTLIARADQALYDAKRKGKNRVVGRKS